MYIYKAAVVGAGVMGAQIAQAISYSGLPVILKDTTSEKAQRGLDTIRAIYRGRVEKGKMTPGEVEQKLALVSGAADYSGFGDVDLVIEAVFEDLAVKKRVFAELDQRCPPATILATNTSSLSVSAIGAATRRPEKVLGLHFFNPAHVMKLVEVIPGLATSSETVDDVVAFSEGMRKIPVRVQECAGFLVNRLLFPYLNEAAIALVEGTPAEEIDRVLTGFGMPMGPFALLDLIGMDVAAHVADILHDSYGPRMTPAPLLAEMVAAGRLGNKAGAGFYVSGEGEPKEELPAVVERVRKRMEIHGKPPAFRADRVILPMVNEAVIALQEGVASAAGIDIAMQAGTGFPQAKGGPLHHADTIGIDLVVRELERLTRELGPRFWPAPMLKRMVAAGHTGRSAGRGFFTS